MKATIRNLLLAAMLVAVSLQTHAQGFVYDQQSTNIPVSVIGNGNADGLNIQEDQPLVQSFIPTLSAIGFVQFELEDIPGNGNNGATVYVKLWTGAPNVNLPSATFLGSTAPVYMPNGFVNSGLGSAGITNFSFSTPITLTAGQTYYLQPVVLSGDDPWDIITIGNTYPNGQVFESGGGFNTDFWFREGVVSAPEPSTLALVGLSSFLIFARKRCRGLLIIVGLSVAIVANAQTYYLQSYGPIPAPYPFDPYGGSEPMIVLDATNHIYLIEDTPDDFAALQSFNSMSRMSGGGMHAMDEPFSPGSGGDDDGGYEPNFPQWTPPTNGDLWLEASNESPNLGLRLHNTIGGDKLKLLC